jgi:hypothetical protein
MRTAAFVVVIFLACSAFAQPAADQNVDRVFHFANTAAPQGQKEISNAIRTIADLQQVSVDNAAGVLAVSGTASRVAMAEWLFVEMDKPASAPAPKPTPLEFRPAGTTNDVARVFYLSNTQTPQGAQELVNAIRSLSEIQRIMVYYAPKALALRGTVEQVAMAEWMISLLDIPAAGPAQDAGTHEFRLTSFPRDNVARVFYPKHAATPQGFQELVNLIRAITDVQRCVADNAPRAVAMRGSADQVALAEWLVHELDKPAGMATQTSAALEYRIPDKYIPVVRIFYPSHADTPQAMQEVVNTMRSIANIQRLSVYTAAKAVTVRGTGDQIARAEQYLKERDKQ